MPRGHTGYVARLARIKSRATLRRMAKALFARGNMTVGKEFMRAAMGRDPYTSRGTTRRRAARRRRR